MQLQVDDKIAAEVLSALDHFSKPIDDLNDLLRQVQDDETRRTFLRQLGEVMVHLEEIGHPLRRLLKRTD
jgi:hypothetical protein